MADDEISDDEISDDEGLGDDSGAERSVLTRLGLHTENQINRVLAIYREQPQKRDRAAKWLEREARKLQHVIDTVSMPGPRNTALRHLNHLNYWLRLANVSGDEEINDDEISDVEILGALDELWTDTLTDDDLMGADDELQGFLDFVAKAASSVIKSPITKIVAGAAAFVIPPIGVPAAAALIVADRAVRVAEGFHGNAKKKKIVTAAIAHTVKLAKAGDPDAKRAAEFMKAAQRVRAATAKRTKSTRGTLVHRGARGHYEISRGSYRAT